MLEYYYLNVIGDSMKPTNLISAYKGAKAYDEMRIADLNSVISSPYSLKSHEMDTLYQLCEEFKKCNVPVSVYDGYYLGYMIFAISVLALMYHNSISTATLQHD